MHVVCCNLPRIPFWEGPGANKHTNALNSTFCTIRTFFGPSVCLSKTNPLAWKVPQLLAGSCVVPGPWSEMEGALPVCRPTLRLAAGGCASSQLLLGSFPMRSLCHRVCANNPPCIPPAQVLVPNAGHHLQGTDQGFANSPKHLREASLIIMPTLQVEKLTLTKVE